MHGYPQHLVSEVNMEEYSISVRYIEIINNAWSIISLSKCRNFNVLQINV